MVKEASLRKQLVRDWITQERAPGERPGGDYRQRKQHTEKLCGGMFEARQEEGGVGGEGGDRG